MKKYLAAIVAVLLVASGGYAWYVSSQPARQDQSTIQTTQTTDSSLVFSNQGKTVSYSGVEGKTALEVLRALTTVTVEDTQYGEMVVGINGVAAMQNKEYWSFYVNGSYASEGAGTYKTKNGEKLEWRLESLQ